MGYQRGAEIGVFYGDYSEELCEGIPGLELYCVDRWAGEADTDRLGLAERLRSR